MCEKPSKGRGFLSIYNSSRLSDMGSQHPKYAAIFLAKVERDGVFRDLTEKKSRNSRNSRNFPKKTGF
jgi:hypothetical protein